MRSHTILSHLLTLAILLVIPPIPVAYAEILSKNPTVLKSASEFDYPPFAIVQPDGTAGGFSVDLLKAATEAVGLSVTFKVGPWNEIKQELADRTLDVLPLVSYSEERSKVYDFTTAYLRMNGTVFVREGDTEIKTLADLKNKEVLVMQGDTAHEYALREKLSDTIIAKATYDEAFKLLASGKHDAIVVQQIVGLQIIKKLHLTNVVAVEQKNITNLKPMALKLEGFEQKFCFAVPEGNKQLLAQLNEGLAIISLNGTYNLLYDKWFAPILPKPQAAFNELVKQFIAILVPLLLLVTMAGLWYLKRLVTKRTRHLELEIEQRKGVEAILKESEIKFRLLFENMLNGFAYHKIITNEDGKAVDYEFIEVNKNFEQLTGLKRADIIGKRITAIHPGIENMAFDWIGTYGNVALTGESVIFEQYFEPQRHWYSVLAYCPQKGYFAVTFENITERKQAEEKLRSSQQLLEGIINSIPSRVFWKDLQLVYRGCNTIFAKDAGFDDPKDIIGKDDYRMGWRDQAESYRSADRQVIDSGCSKLLIEEHQTTPQGNIIDLLTSKVPLHNAKGEISGVLGTYIDITELKRLEEEKKALQAHLQQVQKMEAIGTLAGGIAHDFNNILGAIIGYAELAQEDSQPGSNIRGDIDQVVKASHRAKELVKQILAFSRQAETEHIPLQPALIIKEAVKMLRASLPTTIDIRQNIDAQAGHILADPTQIHQVLINLCTNAFHAMEEKGGILSISLKKIVLAQDDLTGEPRVQPGQFLQISIGDTGPGITPEIQGKMFDPYFTTKEVGKGTGLGLSIIHGIVKTYNGFISCHSQPGEGTIFHVYLPVFEDTELVEGETVPLDGDPFGNEHILYIDDEEILLEVGQSMLERLGYRVTVRRNSLEALHTFQNHPDQFDLVITDQTMPGMTGSDMARRMLQLRPDIPIILCTGYSNLISEDKAKSLGIKGFALKPLAKKDIAVIIRKVLEGVSKGRKALG